MAVRRPRVFFYTKTMLNSGLIQVWGYFLAFDSYLDHFRESFHDCCRQKNDACTLMAGNGGIIFKFLLQENVHF